MSQYFTNVIADQFNLTKEEKNLLEKTILELNRSERRLFFQKLKPREKEFKKFLKIKLTVEKETDWIKITGESLLDKRGEPDLADCMVMDVLGRLKVYRYVREKAEEQSIRLKAFTNFGGLTMVIFIIMIVSAIVLYFLGR